MAWSVKATYRAECRKLTFQTLPTFDELHNQLYRVFPISHDYFLSKLLFSPDSSKSRILIAREVRSAEEYNRAVAQLRGRFFVDPLLRFSVFDETPHKSPTTMNSCSSMSNLSFKDPFIPGSFPTSPALAAARFPDISASHISPADIYVPSRHCPLAPMEVDHSTPTSVPQPQLPTLIPSETPRSAQSHSTTDVESLISRFKLDLDEILQRNRPVMRTTVDLQRSAVPLAQNAQETSIATPLCLYKFCMTCSKLFQGPWYKCSKCDIVMCPSCNTEKPVELFAFDNYCVHTTVKEFCAACPRDDADVAAVPVPQIPTPPPRPIFPPSSIFSSMPLPGGPPFDNPFRSPCNSIPNADVPSQDDVEPASQTVVHTNVVCDVCNETIEGVRHKCLDCFDYDLCTRCILSGSAERHNPFHEFLDISEPGRVIVHRVFDQISESTSVPGSHEDEVVHCATCDLCDSRIIGVRYKCLDCPDFDTCDSCHSIVKEQHPQHSFVKIRNPQDYLNGKTNVPRPMHYATCNACSKGIHGIRYKCMHPDCPDFDLCEICEAHPIPVHPISHVMLKVRAPNASIPNVCRTETCPSLAPRSEEPHSRSHTPITPRELSLPGAFDLPSPLPKPPSPFFYRSASSSPSPEAETGFATPEFMPEPPSLSGLNHLRSLESTPLLHGMPFGLKDSVLSSFGHSNPFESETDQSNVPHRHPDVFHSEWRAACLALQRPISPDALPSIASSGVHVDDGDHGTSNPDISRDRSASPRPWMPVWQQLYDSLQVREVDNAVLDDNKPDQASTATPPSLDSLSASVESINVPVALEHLRSSFTTWPKVSELVHLMGNASLQGDEPNASTFPVEESPLSGTEPLLNRPITFTASNVPEMVQSNKEPVSSGIKSLATLLDDTYRDTPSEIMLAQSGELHAEENVSVDTAAPLLAQFISDVTVADGAVFPPGAEFMKCWKMKNSGSKDWADDTELVFLAGESLARDKFATSAVKVGSVKAGAEVELWTGELKAPEVPGRYVSYYRLRNSDGEFGDNIWLDINVAETGAKDQDSDGSSMTSSSVIIMPNIQPGPSSASALPSAPATVTDDVSEADSETSVSSVTIISVPSDSDSEDEDAALWQDSREYQAMQENQEAVDEFVVLYEESSDSSEED